MNELNSVWNVFLWPLCDQVIREFDQIKPSKIKQSKISLQITDQLKWTLHMWEGAGKHLRVKHNGLKSHPLWQRLLWGGSLVLINDHRSVNKNSEVLLKIYMVEFEIWLGKWKNAPSIGSGIQAKSTNVGKFVHCIPYYRKLTLHQINANC